MINSAPFNIDYPVQCVHQWREMKKLFIYEEAAPNSSD